MRIYISGKISGLNPETYMKYFADAEQDICNNFGSKTEIINPATVNALMPKSFTHKDYMDMSFAMLDKCDAIYMLPNYKDSMGANQELGFAIAKGYTIYYG